MTEPDLETVKEYYDERVEGKLRDFTDLNPRIEAAIRTLAEWAPDNPRRVLEIGCGIGATAWRMARAWPRAEVVGVDVSPVSIEVAKACFRRANLSYREGLIAEATTQKFDFVVLMDVYEHIALKDRPALHARIRSLLSMEARIFLSFPTPALQEDAALHNPAELQPVDEDVFPSDMVELSKATGTRLMYQRDIGVWKYGDYAHCVLGRYESLAPVALRWAPTDPLARFKDGLRALVGAGSTRSAGRRDYLGADLLRSRHRQAWRRFDVSKKERQRLVVLWLDGVGVAVS